MVQYLLSPQFGLISISVGLWVGTSLDCALHSRRFLSGSDWSRITMATIDFEGTTKKVSSCSREDEKICRSNAEGSQIPCWDFMSVKLWPYLQQSVQHQYWAKLCKHYYGVYHIEAKINTAAYRLALPLGSSIQPIFHISLLKSFVGSS